MINVSMFDLYTDDPCTILYFDKQYVGIVKEKTIYILDHYADMYTDEEIIGEFCFAHGDFTLDEEHIMHFTCDYKVVRDFGDFAKQVKSALFKKKRYY